MEKLFYIPTSSLNFNNIVSSESISPSDFYRLRSYGIRRFVDIYEGKYPNQTILADRPYLFSRPESDVEDHPMLIEIRLEENEVTPLKKGFYSTDKTIFINPWTCRFLFFSEQDKLVTKSLSEHSLEVKISKLYIPKMTVVRPYEECDFSKIIIRETSVLNDTCNNDERMNRLKGMLYGYYIGAMLSTSKEEVEKLRILQEVQNEFSAIISAGAGYLSVEKEGRLRDLSTRWQQLSPKYIELQKELQNNGFDMSALTILSRVLKKFGGSLSLPHTENLGLSRYTEYLIQQPVEGVKNPAMEWIEGEIEKQSNSLLRYGKKINPEDGAIITKGVDVINIQIPDHVELVKHWLNTLLLDSKQTARDSYSKMELADMVTDSTIDFMGNNWKESFERVFLNKLRKHIAGEAFDVEWDNGALCSMAAVVLRGDEWDTLLSFMQRKGMYDYRLAFALYGALTGYANMTRDFVDMLFEDKNYGFQVYKEFYGQLLGKDLAPAPNVTPTPIEVRIPEDKDTQAIPKPEKDIGITVPIQVPIKNNEVFRIVDAIRNHPDFKEKYEKNIKKIEEEGLTNWDDIEKIDKWKTFIGKVRPDKQIAKRATKKQEETIYTQGTLFAENRDNLFFCDATAWDKIKDLVPKETQSRLKDDLEWYQRELNKGISKYYPKVRRDSNKETIAIFVRLKDGKSGKQKADYFTEELREIIKQRLMSLYCNNDGENKYNA